MIGFIIQHKSGTKNTQKVKFKNKKINRGLRTLFALLLLLGAGVICVEAIFALNHFVSGVYTVNRAKKLKLKRVVQMRRKYAGKVTPFFAGLGAGLVIACCFPHSLLVIIVIAMLIAMGATMCCRC